MDPPKDHRPQGPHRSTKEEKKDPNKKQGRKPPLPGPHRSGKYQKKTSTSSITSTSSMPPPHPIQPRRTSTSSMPPPPPIHSRRTSTSSMLPLHPSNNSQPSSASLRRTRNNTSLVTMGSDDRSGINNMTLPPSTRNNGLPPLTLPPPRTDNIVQKNVVRYNGPYVPPLNLQHQKFKGRYLSKQPVNRSQSLLTALQLLMIPNPTRTIQSSLFSNNSSSSTYRTVMDTLQVPNNPQSTPENRIERIQQNLSALQRGTISLIGFEVEEGKGRKLTFTFQYEDYRDTIIYYEHSGKLSFYITKNGKAVSRTVIPENVRVLFLQLDKLIRNTIWDKVSFNDKDYVLVFDKKSYQNAYFELKDGKYVFIDLEDCEYYLKSFLIDEAISMEEDYEATTFFTDLERDLQSIYHVYTDPDDGIRKLTEIEPNKTWTYKNDITFSVDPDYTMTNVTSKVKELIKKLEDNPDDETLKNLYFNEYLEKPVEDCDADINLIQGKLEEMKANRGL